MNKFIGVLVILFAVVISGCTVNKKAQLQALADCQYEIESIEQVTLNGRELREFRGTDGSYKLSALAGLATALFSNELPLDGTVNLRISNPENKRAAFNSFRYIIALQNQPLFEGTVDQNVSLAQNENIVVPLSFRANIFAHAKERGVERLLDDLLGGKSEGALALKIKPSIRIAGQNIYYPAYITVDKNFGKRIFELL